MDKPHHNSAASPGYETTDANVRGVFNFLVFLGVLLIGAALASWGLFRHLSKSPAPPASVSPFAETRQLPLGPQLQVNPRNDWLKYRDQEAQSLETYSWENRGAGTVHVPIERAMELLVQKGLPVQDTGEPETESGPAKAPAAEKAKPAAQVGKKP